MLRATGCAGLALLGASLAFAAPPAPTPAPATPPAAAPATAPAGDNAAAVTDDDFVKTASAAGLAEVNFGRLAAQQATSADVKAFGQHMVDDHTKANMELNKVADKAGFTPASKMDAKHQELFTTLSGLKGADFDREYVASQVADHKVAVALFTAESKQGKNDDLKAFAGMTLPTLQHHLDMVQKLAGASPDGRTPTGVKPDVEKKPDTEKRPDTDRNK